MALNEREYMLDLSKKAFKQRFDVFGDFVHNEYMHLFEMNALNRLSRFKENF